MCGHSFKKYPRSSRSFGSWKGRVRSCPNPSTCCASYMDLRAQRKFRHGQSSPILDAKSVAAQHQVELQVVHDDQAAYEGSSNPGVSADEDKAALNAKFRRAAMGYLAQNPLGGMVIIRKVFESFRRLLLDQVGHGSDKWEKEAAQYRGAEQVAGGLRSGESTAWKWRLWASLTRGS